MDIQVCVVSLRILNGERSRGSGSGGGGNDCDGMVARAVERQRMQGLCGGDGLSNRFQQVDCRIVGAVDAMGGTVYTMRMKGCRRR